MHKDSGGKKSTGDYRYNTYVYGDGGKSERSPKILSAL